MTGHACQHCGVDPEQIAQDIANLQTQNRALLRKVNFLQGELTKQRKANPNVETAAGLFEHYRAELGKNANTIYDDKREKQLLDAIAIFDHTPVDGPALIRKAITGLALRRYVGPQGRMLEGTAKQRYDDLKYVLRDGAESIERFAGYVDQHQDATAAVTAKVENEEQSRRDGSWITTTLGRAGSQGVPLTYPQGLRLVLERLGDRGLEVRGSGGSFKAQCPAHDDREPSLQVTEKPDGRVLLHCFAGCGTSDVLASLGLGFGEIGPYGPSAEFVAARGGADQLSIERAA